MDHGTRHRAMPRHDRSNGLRLAVGIATAGRAPLVSRLAASLQDQTRPPDLVVVCAPTAADVSGLDAADPRIRVVLGPRGLPSQRNAILRVLDGFDVVVFLDDDFVACPRYLQETAAAFLSHPDVVMTTGRLVADGICGPGLTDDDALSLLASDPHPNAGRMAEVTSGYGCNMALRMAPVQEHQILFEESLPLYGWLEDVDFSTQIGRFGRIVRVPAARGVHLGVKRGRQAGNRLGYSQISNPLFLVRKGTCSWQRAAYLISRNLAANIARCAWPEPYVDRVGRLSGNLRAILDLATGRLHPSRILSL